MTFDIIHVKIRMNLFEKKIVHKYHDQRKNERKITELWGHMWQHRKTRRGLSAPNHNGLNPGQGENMSHNSSTLFCG